MEQRIAASDRIPEGFVILSRRSKALPSDEYCIVECHNLTLDTRRTEKQLEKPGMLGTGFAGLELKGAHLLKVKVKASPELGGRNKNTFAGFMVDYQTASGYTKRVALEFGSVHKDRASTVPTGLGKGGVPDDFVDLGVKEILRTGLAEVGSSRLDGAGVACPAAPAAHAQHVLEG